MSNTKSILYEVRINPFRSESGIVKSDDSSNQYNLLDQVVVLINRETFLGQITKVMDISTPVSSTIFNAPSFSIIRKANDEDLSRNKTVNRRNEETQGFFEDLLKKFKIVGKVVLIDWDFDHHKVYCYITSERKINYLLLHETAVDTLKTRVAIKQIGIRDYARSISGLGICGRELCCRVFLSNIQSVTLSMARQQNIYVEPEKISGCCGKLRCCIGYESRTF